MTVDANIWTCDRCDRPDTVDHPGGVCADCQRQRKLERDRSYYRKKTSNPRLGRPKVELASDRLEERVSALESAHVELIELLRSSGVIK